jgi:hypothetical protein
MRHVAVLLLAWLAVADLPAQGKGRGKGKGNSGRPEIVDNRGGNGRFGDRDIGVISQWYGANPVNLPPGLQKKLARGKPLPPGWQRKLQPFPSDLDGRLGPLCTDCGRGVIDGYGIIYNRRTAMILDAVRLAGDLMR